MMKSKYMFQIFFLVIAMILDAMVMAVFPVDYSFKSYFFISMFGFTLIILFLSELSSLNAVVLAFCYGLVLDFFSSKGFFINALSIMLTIAFVYLLGKRLSYTKVEVVMLVIFGVFMRELLMFAFASGQGVLSISFYNYLQKQMFGSVLFNTVFCFIAFGLNNGYRHFMKRNDQRLRRSEKSLRYR